MIAVTEPTHALELNVRQINRSEHPLRAERSVDVAALAKIRRKVVLDACKWDPQVGDNDTLAPFPLVMPASEWRRLAQRAEKLFAEACVAEEEVLRQPELIKQLGYPKKLSRVLGSRNDLSPSAGRITRFDFHFTRDGWRISEANSDVPGGFAEGSAFTKLIAEEFPELSIAGDPSQTWASALATACGADGTIALLSAPGYMEDHQVIAHLARVLEQCGCRAFAAKPEQIKWRDGVAYLRASWHQGPLSLIVKFYQAEWLARSSKISEWQHFFRRGKTLVTNPAAGVISESKRFPLIWNKLSANMPTWRALLPETRDPRHAPWMRDVGWILKTAMCNNGDTVTARDTTPNAAWARRCADVLLSPRHWVAQRRFESVPIPTPHGPRHVCVGVFVVNGRAAGAYTRMSAKPIIDFAATDVALLIAPDE